ncbi:MAG: Alkaline phosphatase synthesis transcriptional regulatory protein PhoP [Candidatus Omnitrophica bacterium]|nr:Alkaline phosphatase synthesis transcriptional regulatory protein PhoP [Candidatus Omnitrophota bacterium]
MLNKKILIVDDETDLVDILRHRLERAGYQVVTAYDGEQAMAIAHEQRPDLILLDIIMPRLDGQTVLRLLRADDGYREIKIVMVTACSDEDNRTLALKNGANDYISKPVELQGLCGKIEEIFSES